MAVSAWGGAILLLVDLESFRRLRKTSRPSHCSIWSPTVVLIGICELIAAQVSYTDSAAYAGSWLFVLTGAGLAHVGPLGYDGINIFAPTYALLIVVILRWREFPSHRRADTEFISSSDDEGRE